MNQEQEKQRIEELRSYSILDTDPEEIFDRIARLAQKITQTPIALISLVDEDRQWFKSHIGLDVTETPRNISFCTHAIEKDQPLIVHDALEDPRFMYSPLVTGAPYIRFYAGVPLTTPAGHNIGTLCIIDRIPRTLSFEQIDMLRDLACIVMDEIELHAGASSDSLTGLDRKSSFMQKAQLEMDRANRYGSNFSILALDVDDFRSITHRFGHNCGNMILRKIAEICRKNLRSIDVSARMSEEEYVILLPETELSEALTLAERIRKLIEEMRIEHAGYTIQVTTSFGVADRKTCGASNIRTVLNAADDWLCEAKSNGRNSIMPKAA